MVDVYKQFFRSYPVSQLDVSEEKRHAANFGGKIYLPASALGRLTMMRISYPMLFELRPGQRSNDTKVTYAGVLEFISPEGRVYLPEWMMHALKLKTGGLMEIRSTSLVLGSFVKIEPQSVDFLDISDPKAVLENSLRNFSALTVGDVFQISYNNQVYEIKVLEVKPESSKPAICVVETDLSVDFAPPVGYDDQAAKRPKVASPMSTGSGEGVPLAGTEIAAKYLDMVKTVAQGIRLNGKEVKVEIEPVNKAIYTDLNAPPLELPEGQLFFGFPVVPVGEEEGEDVFGGEGRALRENKRKR